MSLLPAITARRNRRGSHAIPPWADLPAPTGFSDGYDTFGLEGNEFFSTSSPTLKDGTAITGDGLTNYDAAMYWALDTTPGGADIEVALSAVESYETAREGQNGLDAITHLFRMTGDLRLLDRLCDAYEGLRAA